MLNSVEELDIGMTTEGRDELEGLDKFLYDRQSKVIHAFRKIQDIQCKDYSYWIDNCGDDKWYCEHCLQPDCTKREAECLRYTIK